MSLLMLLASAMTQRLSAQKLAKEIFVSMPDSILPYLTSVNRADFIDFMESNMKARVTNRFDQTTEMTELAPDYIRLNLTPESSWQMKLLSLNDTVQVVCVVYTVCAPVCDSRVAFYTIGWEALPTERHLEALPTVSDFVKSDSIDAQEGLTVAFEALDVRLLKIDLSADSSDMLVTFSTMDYIGESDRKKIEPYITPAMTFRWEEGKFKR